MRWKLNVEGSENPSEVELIRIQGTEFLFKVDGEEVRLTQPEVFPYSLRTSEVNMTFESWTADSWRAVSEGRSFTVQSLSGSSGFAANKDEVRSQMPGRVLKVLVKPGEKVQPRQTLLILEAMKMENEIRAEAEGTIQSVEVSQGQSVESGALLLKLAS